MRPLFFVTLLSCGGGTLAQDPVPSSLHDRIGTFVLGAGTLLDRGGSDMGSIETCDNYQLIAEQAASLADELSKVGRYSQSAGGEELTAYALASTNTPSTETYYQLVSLRSRMNSSSKPRGYNTLREVQELALLTIDSRSAAQMARRHGRLVRHLDHLWRVAADL